jgi:HK97 family phage portal protein
MAVKAQNWFQKTAFGLLKKAATANAPFISSVAASYLTNPVMLFNSDYIKQYKNWVFACVQARAEEVGNVHFELYVGDEIVDDHEVLDLLNKPNPYMTRHDFLMAHQAFLDLDGNSFWFLSRANDGKGAIAEMYLLRPDRVSIVPDKTNPLAVSGYVFTQPDGARIPFDPQEILHFKNFNPLGWHPFPHRGMGIVEAAIWAIETDNEAREWNYKFFKNSARPDGILTTPGDAAMDPDELLRIRAEWDATHNGSSNASRVAILGGGLSWTEIARSQKDMDFVQQRTFSRDEILALFRVPRTIVGITDDVNRANADASIYVFSLRTVKPLMQRLSDHISEMLLPEYGDDLTMDFASPVAEDRKESMDVYAAGLSQGWLTINEVREQEGLPVVDAGNSLYMPLNMVPVAETTPEPAIAPKAAKKGKGKKKRTKSIASEAVEKLIESRKAKGTLPAAKKTFTVKSISPEVKEKYINIWKSNLQISQTPLRNALVSYFEKQEAEVLANARHIMKRRTKAALKKGLFDFLFDAGEAQTASISLITPFIKDYIERSGGAAADLMGSTFDANTQTLQKFIEKRSQYFADTINGTTKEALLTSIKDGLDNGENLSQIESRIGSVYDIAKGSRTQMIARTEISAASNQGAIGAYQQAGVAQIEWAVVDPTDADCLENDGQVVGIGEAFNSGDTEPPVHPNCECTTIPVFNN